MDQKHLYTPVRFYNPTDEDFSHTWNKELYTFPSKRTVYMEMWKAKHFAKHLVDRELNKQQKQTNHFSRTELESKCILTDGSLEVGGPETAKDVIAQENRAMEQPKQAAAQQFCDTCDSKGVRHKKGCPKSKESLGWQETVE